MQRYKNHVLLSTSWLILLAVSCSKETTPPTTEPPPIFGEPIKKPTGRPLGDSFSAFIGTDGGVLSYGSDVQLAILSQTITEPTEFSIQPISNTLDETGAGPAFRLTPEHIRFQKPVKLTFSYDRNVEGNPKTRMVAFQREDGVWCGVPTALDEARRQLTIETTHFSDWVWFDFITLRKDKTSVGAGGQVELKLMEQVLGALTTNEIDSVPLAALDDIGFSNGLTITGWRIVSGPGKLETTTNSKGLPGNAIYTAPANITAAADVEIEVQVESRNGYISDPSAPNGRRKFGKLTLLTTIRLEPENYFFLEVNGVRYDLSGGAAATVSGGQIIVGGATIEGTVMTLTCHGTSSGSYPGGLNAGQTLLLMTIPSGGGALKPFQNHYMQCPDIQFSGTTEISRNNGVIEGTFSGTVYHSEQACGFNDSKTVNCLFKIKQGQ